jgi:hypothetical protein
MGDFNAKVGDDWNTWNGVIGKFSYGQENEIGQRLLEFCLHFFSPSLKVMNTVFYQRKANRKLGVTKWLAEKHD